MKQLGEAASDEERQVEAAIVAIADWQGRDIRYRRIAAGITNLNWHLLDQAAGCSYFLKIPGAKTDLFIDRAVVHDANVKAAASGVAPRVLHYLPQTQVEVFEFLEDYRPAYNGDFENRDLLANSLRALRTLQDGAAFLSTRTYGDTIEEHHRLVGELGAARPADFDWMLSRYRQAWAALTAAGLDLVPCRNDGYVSNFMIDEQQRVMLVDFDYAANNDRCAELAIWFFELFLPDRIEDEMIEVYFGAWRRDLKARIAIYKALVCIKWSMWCMIQQRISTLDFDFYKYGQWLQLRGRHHLRDERWDEHLRAL